VRKVNDVTVTKNYQQIKQDVQNIAEIVLEELLSDPAKCFWFEI